MTHNSLEFRPEHIGRRQFFAQLLKRTGGVMLGAMAARFILKPTEARAVTHNGATAYQNNKPVCDCSTGGTQCTCLTNT